MAARSSADILNEGLTFFAGDVNDFIFSFSMSKRIFSLRLRRSSSFQSRTRRGRDGSEMRQINWGWLFAHTHNGPPHNAYLHPEDFHNSPTMNNVSHSFHRRKWIRSLLWAPWSVWPHWCVAVSQPSVSSCQVNSSCRMSCLTPNAMVMVWLMVPVAVVVCLLELWNLHKLHRHEPDYRSMMHFQMMNPLVWLFANSECELWSRRIGLSEFKTWIDHHQRQRQKSDENEIETIW